MTTRLLVMMTWLVAITIQLVVMMTPVGFDDDLVVCCEEQGQTQCPRTECEVGLVLGIEITLRRDSPVGRDDDPVGGSNVPVGGDDVPVGGDDNSVSGDDDPVGGDDVPVGGDASRLVEMMTRLVLTMTWLCVVRNKVRRSALERNAKLDTFVGLVLGIEITLRRDSPVGRDDDPVGGSNVPVGGDDVRVGGDNNSVSGDDDPVGFDDDLVVCCEEQGQTQCSRTECEVGNLSRWV
ncbi:hypothetical protein J6590_014898 [Homalodisca vitripennis]|nr:hypothetical protein J6590_014898 [Homalodisca vitripennis]